MSLKEILFIICGTLLLVGGIIVAAYLFLEYGTVPDFSRPEADVDCADGDFRELCGIRTLFTGRANAEW